MNAELQLDSLDDLSFDNRFVRDLPADPEKINQRRQVNGACYSFVSPARVKQPELVAYSKEMADQLGFSEKLCQSDLFAQVFSGNHLLTGMQPYAMCYGGHQFGNWAGQLGDGRAINLGEVLNQSGERFTLQLKGAGPTPYSRGADGLAVLRSSVREFLCSEAMHHLGVPTTRALSLTLTGEEVVRDMFYDGHPQAEPGAIVCRVAPSFTRFGNFQLFASNGEIDQLRQLVDFTIRSDLPHLGKPSKETYLAWFEEVCRRTAAMIVHWQRVGFVHGVMNTDNMSILGLTIDYGPYGWLENYDPDWTPNTTDAQGRRYRYGHQPQIAMWNLVQLANALYPLIEETEPLEKSLDVYPQSFQQGWQDMMAQKLGLKAFEETSDKALIDDLLATLKLVETDMTIFYRQLARVNTNIKNVNDIDNDELMAPLMDAYYVPDQISEDYKESMANWLRSYIKRAGQDNRSDEERRSAMNKVNPKYVLRNYLAQLAIDKSEQGDHSLVNELLDLLRRPYDEQPDMEQYYEKRPDWARQRAGCSMLSCSS
jgi:protein adenylyltransferase